VNRSGADNTQPLARLSMPPLQNPPCKKYADGLGIITVAANFKAAMSSAISFRKNQLKYKFSEGVLTNI